MEIIKRRSFLAAAMAALPLALAADSAPQQAPNRNGAASQPPSGAGPEPPSSAVDSHLVRNGEARNAEHHTIGVSYTDYKVLTADTGGDLFVFQHANHKKGGPPRHLHHHEDEYFYVLEGEYIVEVDSKRFISNRVTRCWALAACRTPGPSPVRRLAVC